jgi:membrane-associated phospholipid phosphatase
MTDLDSRYFAVLYGGAHGPLGAPMMVLTLVGGGWAALALIPMVAWPGRPAVRTFGRALAAATAGQALLVVAIKAAVGRVRPWIAMSLPAPIGAPHDGSFPSGHAAGAFCVATFLALAMPEFFPGSPWRARLGAAAALTVAALVALSRVYLGAHFPTDVLGGALLGCVVGGAGAVAYRTMRRDGAAPAVQK